jgi:hypothetical protein
LPIFLPFVPSRLHYFIPSLICLAPFQSSFLPIFLSFNLARRGWEGGVEGGHTFGTRAEVVSIAVGRG